MTEAGRRALSRWLPVAAVAGFTAWAVLPLVRERRLFAAALEGDYLRGAWLYDFTARGVARGWLPLTFTDFGWPAPITRRVTLPNVVDAAMAAPLAWIAGWPHQLGLTMALAVAWAALGLGWLARSLGCGSLGATTAGCLGAVMWPLWREMNIGRMNDAWIGVAFAATAAFLDLLRADDATPPGPLRLTMRVAVAGGLGALALCIYPPYMAMLLPVGVVAGLPELARRPARGILLLGAAGALAVGLAWPELMLMATRSRQHRPPCVAGGCPKDQWYVDGIRMLGVTPRDGGLWLPWSGVAVGSWILAPLAILHPRRWGRGTGLLALAAACAYLALGSCPTLDPPALGAARFDPDVDRFHAWLWCVLEPLHDYARFLAAGAGIAAVLSALGVDALASRGRILGAVGLLLAIASVGHAAWALRLGTLPGRWWHEVETPVTATFLADAAPGPVAELPWDETRQYLSVLADPGRPRVNPVAPQFNTESRAPFIRWLDRLGRGEIPDWTPSAGQIAASGVRWVLHDPARCAPVGSASPAACRPAALLALTAALGEATPLADGVKAWEIRSAAAAP